MAEGSRVFNIKMGPNYIKKGFDILRGGHTAEVQLYVPFTLTEKNTIIYNGEETKGALVENHLMISFETITDNPKINGLIMYRGDLKDTDYYKVDKIQEVWNSQFKTIMESENMRDQIMEEYVKKKRLRKKMRNDYEDGAISLEEESEMTIIDLNDTTEKKGFGLKKIFLSMVLFLSIFCIFNRRKLSKKGLKSKIVDNYLSVNEVMENEKNKIHQINEKKINKSEEKNIQKDINKEKNQS